MDSGITGLFQQLPPGIPIMFCGSGILLVIALIYIFRTRAQKAEAAAAEPANNAAPVPMSEAELSELPGLDDLASAEMVKAAPPHHSGTSSIMLTDGGSVDAVEVLTILRDVADGGLIIRIGDKIYRNPPAVADAEFKRRFHNALRDLNGVQQPVPDPVPEPVEPAEPDAAPDTSRARETPPPVRRTQSFEPAPGDLPKFKMPDAPVKPRRGQRPINEPIPEINIAGSIEAFLQHKLAQFPEYDNRSIHVRSAMHGGVTIEVDGSFYESVGEVSDTVVRQFLSSTIEEWQARQ